MKAPEIIAHRGASRERPENTVSAFQRAAELGADGIELDVFLTADGVLVVHHDPFPRNPPSDTLAGRPIPSLTFRELSAFRVKGEPIPTLEQVADLGEAICLYCELKGPGTAGPTVALIAGQSVRAAVHAFDHRQIAEAWRIAPLVPRGVLEASYHMDPTWPMTSVHARDLWQCAELVDRPLVEAVHAVQGRVVAWTVDDPAEMLRLAALGVDALCTNDVALARATFGR